MQTPQTAFKLVSPLQLIPKDWQQNNRILPEKRAAFLRPLQQDTFTPSVKQVALRQEPIFKKLNLTPSIATEADLPEVAQLIELAIKEDPLRSANNFINMFKRRSDSELKHFFKHYLPKDELPSGVSLDAIWPEFKALFFEPNKLTELLKGNSNAKEYIPIIKRRFFDNPQGAMLVLKDKNGKIVAREGVNQFQKTHDMQIDTGIMEGIDPKHGLLTGLHVLPQYRKQGIGMAMKKTVIQYARDHLGYRYVHSPAETTNASHRLNKTLGYQPMTPETRFEDSPAFTPEVVNNLIEEYNHGKHQLCWLDTRNMK